MHPGLLNFLLLFFSVIYGVGKNNKAYQLQLKFKMNKSIVTVSQIERFALFCFSHNIISEKWSSSLLCWVSNKCTMFAIEDPLVVFFQKIFNAAPIPPRSAIQPMPWDHMTEVQS